MRGVRPEVFEVCWYLLILLKHVVYLRIILCFTHAWFQPYVWFSHARKWIFTSSKYPPVLQAQKHGIDTPKQVAFGNLSFTSFFPELNGLVSDPFSPGLLSCWQRLIHIWNLYTVHENLCTFQYNVPELTFMYCFASLWIDHCVCKW